MTHKTLLFFLLTILSLSCLYGKTELLKKELDNIRIKNGFPGANLTIILPDNSTIQISSGYTDKSHRQKIKTTDRMFSGSVGKTYVAAVLMKLIEAGKVSLDDQVSQILGMENGLNQIPNYLDLTIRNLMNHSSGIPRHIFVKGFAKAVQDNPDKHWKPIELLQFIMDKKPLFPAGKGWSYADTNYILIGMVIEKISKDSYYNQLKKKFFIPYKLTKTSPAVGRHFKNLIPGYTGKVIFNFQNPVSYRERYIVDPQFEWTGGGLISNSTDLARWAKILYSGMALKPESYREMFQIYSEQTGQKIDHGNGYGLGVQIWNNQLGQIYGHGGIFPGYQTVIKYYERYDIAIALQINEDRTSNPKLKGIYDFVDHFIQLIIKDKKIQ